ncbi:hypothetical protein SLI_3346 [Streptomyces lividans 1326]|uniref:Uncharacterized protein n=1 Tax=Streptomyces lividans 1326 TaxID=1200984 RepID=A0A7U9DQ22_STRLI|nr:hypothetical protein SLI_3346 [Streptomyces lividans 1326]
MVGDAAGALGGPAEEPSGYVRVSPFESPPVTSDTSTPVPEFTLPTPRARPLRSPASL